VTVTSSVHDGDLLTWEQYGALTEDTRGECIDGRLVANAPPDEFHQTVPTRLLIALTAGLPRTHRVLPTWGWEPVDDEFEPDLIVYALADRSDPRRFTGTPDLCVEVLSSNRRHDLVLKMTRYAAAGLPRYWIVDPRDRTLTTYVLEDGTFRPTEVLHDTDPPEQLDLGLARLVVDAAALFAD